MDNKEPKDPSKYVVNNRGEEPPAWYGIAIMVLFWPMLYTAGMLIGGLCTEPGFSWQVNLALSLLFLLMFTVGIAISIRIMRKISKEKSKKPSMTADIRAMFRMLWIGISPQSSKAPSRSTFPSGYAFLMMRILVIPVLAVLVGLYIVYSWPTWTLLLPAAVVGVLWIGTYIYRKLPSKMNSRKQQGAQNLPNNFNKELNMNEGPLRPTNNLDEQERKRRAIKVMIPSMCLGIVGLGLWVLSFSLDVSRTVSILIMTIGGLCWGTSGALSLRVILTAIQMQQQVIPSQEQLQKNQSKIKWLSIAVILLFTAGMFVASLFIFQ